MKKNPFADLIAGVTKQLQEARQEEREALRKVNPTPAEFHIELDANPAWTKEPAVAALMGQLTGLGFGPGTAYQIPEFKQTYLVLFHPDGNTVGCINSIPTSGVWVDMTIYYQDGSELTVTTAPNAGSVFDRPGYRGIPMKGATPVELYTRLQSEASSIDTPIHVVTPENYVENATAVITRDLAWHRSKDGLTTEEYRRVVTNKYADKSEEERKQMIKDYLEKKTDKAYTYLSSCTEYFWEIQTQYPADDRWKYEEFIVSNRIDPTAFLRIYGEKRRLTDEQRQSAKALIKEGALTEQVFEHLIAPLSPRQRPKELGEVDDPIPARIFGFRSRSGND